MFENVNKEGGQVAAEAEAEAAEGLLAQRVAAFEGGGESPIANRSSRMDGWRDLWIYTMGIERRHKFLHCLPIVVLYFDLRESHS